MVRHAIDRAVGDGVVPGDKTAALLVRAAGAGQLWRAARSPTSYRSLPQDPADPRCVGPSCPAPFERPGLTVYLVVFWGRVTRLSPERAVSRSCRIWIAEADGGGHEATMRTGASGTRHANVLPRRYTT